MHIYDRHSDPSQIYKSNLFVVSKHLYVMPLSNMITKMMPKKRMKH